MRLVEKEMRGGKTRMTMSGTEPKEAAREVLEKDQAAAALDKSTFLVVRLPR